MRVLDWIRGRRGDGARVDGPNPETYDLIRQMREQAQKAKLQEYMIRKEKPAPMWFEEGLMPRRSEEGRDRTHESE